MGAVLTKLIFITMKNFKRTAESRPAPWNGFLDIPTTEDDFDDVENNEKALVKIIKLKIID